MTELIFVVLVTWVTCGLLYWFGVRPKRKKRKPAPIKLTVNVYTNKGLVEVLMFDRELSDTELKDLVQYLSLKWRDGRIEVIHTRGYIE